MKDKIFGVLQRVGRSFMLPIAILPVAGLLLGLGGSFTNETMLETYGLLGVMGPGTVFNAVFLVMNDAGNIVFSNLPIIFAMGVAIGMAKKEKEVAALAAAISFFIMHASISAMITINGGTENMLDGATASACGITSLQMGVFGGIIVGLGVAALHNKFYKIQLPQVICTDYFSACLHRCGHFNVLCMAGDPDRYLCSRKCSAELRIRRNMGIWIYGASVNPIRTPSCVLPSVLADRSWRQHGGCRTDD